MKILLTMDTLNKSTGTERAVLYLIKALDCDVYTTDFDLEKLPKEFEKYSNKIISEPLKRKNKLMRSIECMDRFESLKSPGDYDFHIISGQYCGHFAYGLKPNLWFCFSPNRGIYSLYWYYMNRKGGFFRKQMFRLWSGYKAYRDQRAVSRIDNIVAISNVVRTRVYNTYGKSANVVYLPIETKDFGFREFGEFYLTVNQIVPTKRIDLQIEAFRKMPDKKLIVVGKKNPQEEGYFKKITKNCPDNVEIILDADWQRILDLYSRCKAAIYTPIDEDFGYIPIEANASGKQVIAVREGGCLETVIPEKTGLHIQPAVEGIINAVNRIEEQGEGELDEKKKDCMEWAANFDISVFKSRMEKEIGS